MPTEIIKLSMEAFRQSLTLPPSGRYEGYLQLGEVKKHEYQSQLILASNGRVVVMAMKCIQPSAIKLCPSHGSGRNMIMLLNGEYLAYAFGYGYGPYSQAHTIIKFNNSQTYTSLT